MRILGVDFGEARIGIAVSDPLGFLASGVGNVLNRNFKEAAREVAGKAQELGAEKIVVGYPKNMNGTVGERAEKCAAFAKEVGKHFAAGADEPHLHRRDAREHPPLDRHARRILRRRGEILEQLQP